MVMDYKLTLNTFRVKIMKKKQYSCLNELFQLSIKFIENVLRTILRKSESKIFYHLTISVVGVPFREIGEQLILGVYPPTLFKKGNTVDNFRDFFVDKLEDHSIIKLFSVYLVIFLFQAVSDLRCLNHNSYLYV